MLRPLSLLPYRLFPFFFQATLAQRQLGEGVAHRLEYFWNSDYDRIEYFAFLTEDHPRTRIILEH